MDQFNRIIRQQLMIPQHESEIPVEGAKKEALLLVDHPLAKSISFLLVQSMAMP